MTTPAPHQWLDGPSFDLGIDNDVENVSLLIVEDSLDGETENIQNALFEGDIKSFHNAEVTGKKIESLKGIEDGASVDNDFDLNKVPNEAVMSPLKVCVDEEAMKSDKVKNLNQKVVQPYERAFLDLNRDIFDLNKFPDDGLDFGPESEELKKEYHQMLKIYLDSAF